MSDLNRFKNNPFLSELPFVNIAKGRRKVTHNTGDPEFVDTPDSQTTRKWLRNYTRHIPIPFNHSRESLPDFHRNVNVGILIEEPIVSTDAPEGPLVQESPPSIVDGLVQISDTEYYRFSDSTAYSYGPQNLEEAPVAGALDIWRTYYDSGNFVIEKYDNADSTWDQQTTVAYTAQSTLTNVSMTFDQLGFVIISWADQGNVYLYWYDPDIQSTTITTIEEGTTPFVALSTFSDDLDPNRQIYLVYVDNLGNLVHRNQDDRYTVKYDIDSNVEEIIGFGSTAFNNIKIVYVKTENNQLKIRTIATDRLGVLQSEFLEASTIESEVVNMELVDPVNTEQIPAEEPLVATPTADNFQIVGPSLGVINASLPNPESPVISVPTVSNMVVDIYNPTVEINITEDVVPVTKSVEGVVNIEKIDNGIVHAQSEDEVPIALSIESINITKQ